MACLERVGPIHARGGRPSLSAALLACKGLRAILLRAVGHGMVVVGGVRPALWRCVHRLPGSDIWEAAPFN